MKYSNVTKEEFSEIFRKMKEGKPVPRDIAVKVTTRTAGTVTCRFAEDTGSLALITRPCKGNRIICHHPEMDGNITYAKICNQANCRYYQDI